MDCSSPCQVSVQTQSLLTDTGGGFKVQMMVKDFTLAMNAAKQVDAKLVLGDAGLAAYRSTAEDERCRCVKWFSKTPETQCMITGTWIIGSSIGG